MDSTDSGSFSNSGSSTFGRCGFVTFGAPSYGNVWQSSAERKSTALGIAMFFASMLHALVFWEKAKSLSIFWSWSPCQVPVLHHLHAITNWLVRAPQLTQNCVVFSGLSQNPITNPGFDSSNIFKSIESRGCCESALVFAQVLSAQVDSQVMVPLGTISRFPQFVFFFEIRIYRLEISLKNLLRCFMVNFWFIHLLPDIFHPRRVGAACFEAALLSLYESWESQGCFWCLLVSKVSEIWVYLGIFLSH